MMYELAMCDDFAVEELKKKYGLLWKFRCGVEERSDIAWKHYEKLQKGKGIIKPKINRKNIKPRKLLGRGWIKCPNDHEGFSNVYQDNGLKYYVCSTCGMVVGLPITENVKEGGFTGHNCKEIMALFEQRSSKHKSTTGDKR